MHVYLIGYRGSGKTTVGKLLAARLGWSAVDCDDLVEAAAQQSIREIFAKEGESGFRDREQAIVEQLAAGCESLPRVVSLGGGAILREANRHAICRSGRRVWLTASPETLVRRIRLDSSTAERRPALSALNDYEEVVNILEVRRPLYMAVAQKIVDTESLSAEAISDDIARWLNATDK
jgi:shikimate kinase